jgi:hypothetical protein
LTCASVRPAALADDLIDSPGANNKCPKEGHLVALVIAPGYDFHWYRKGRNGYWTHKPGRTQATNVDNSGVLILVETASGSLSTEWSPSKCPLEWKYEKTRLPNLRRLCWVRRREDCYRKKRLGRDSAEPRREVRTPAFLGVPEFVSPSYRQPTVCWRVCPRASLPSGLLLLLSASRNPDQPSPTHPGDSSSPG